MGTDYTHSAPDSGKAGYNTLGSKVKRQIGALFCGKWSAETTTAVRNENYGGGRDYIIELKRLTENIHLSPLIREKYYGVGIRAFPNERSWFRWAAENGGFGGFAGGVWRDHQRALV